jgi:tripartite-type tricarboxylate transporter receptor subunit TctC
MFGRPYALAPEVPKDRVQLLRAGFVAMAKDKDFLIDADKLQMSIDVASGADVQALIERMYAAPREVVERAKKAIRP